MFGVINVENARLFKVVKRINGKFNDGKKYLSENHLLTFRSFALPHATKSSFYFSNLLHTRAPFEWGGGWSLLPLPLPLPLLLPQCNAFEERIWFPIH